ncbi:MAG: GIY-YIG nuclease family protein [Prevotella sp.]|nr:GIY-YIG nuclease family protein [Prevotella sp.]
MDYEQFENEPGKSVSLLNNDPKWNRFVRFESNNDEELIAIFKRKEFKDYVVRKAYGSRVVSFRSIEQSKGFSLDIHISPLITTYFHWAEKREPFIRITANIRSPFVREGFNQVVFDFSFLVRAPFAGSIDTLSFRIEQYDQDSDEVHLYKICTAIRAKGLWPSLPVYDNLDLLDCINVRFNEYKYSENFYEGIPCYDFQTEDKFPCLRYDWKVLNFSNVTKGQHVCSIIKNPYEQKRIEYKIYSPVSGIIAFGINSEKTEYRYQREMCINDLFSLYKDRHLMLLGHFLNSELVEKDNFDNSSISLKWTSVAGRKLPPSEDDIFETNYNAFEMTSDSGKSIFVSLQLRNNIPYIVFSVNSKIIRLSNGDSVDMLFKETSGETTLLNFPITKNYVNESLRNLYDTSYFCELSFDDMTCLLNNDCINWRVRFSKQPLMSISGTNESYWCPREYAGEVFKIYAEQFWELIKDLREENTILFTSQKVNNGNVLANEPCYVYLMYDTSNGYYKIGISNQPEYRERTLQSEKPTIEKICAKPYPNRTIASAIESALHKAYEIKRIRGEWFALDASDVNAIIATLS